MPHYQFELTAKGPDGRDYLATVFQEAPSPNPERLLADVEKQNPAFTDVAIVSANMITPERYSMLVRQMCDSDGWGFRVI